MDRIDQLAQMIVEAKATRARAVARGEEAAKAAESCAARVTTLDEQIASLEFARSVAEQYGSIAQAPPRLRAEVMKRLQFAV